MSKLPEKKFKNSNLPHSPEAEQIILGILITNQIFLNSSQLTLTKEDFYQNEHKEIFTAIINLSLDKKKINITSLIGYLESKNKLTLIGGITYLSELINNVPTTSDLSIYIEILKKKKILRESILISNKLINYCLNEHNKKTITEILYETEKNLHKLREIKKKQNDKNNPLPIVKILKNVIISIDKLTEINTCVTGIPTGFKDFDKMTAGLQPASLTIIAGRPSMGKTTFALNIIENTLKKSNKTIIFFSLEMQAKQIATKILASLAKINLQNLNNGQLTEIEWKKITTNITTIIKKNLYIDDSSTLNIVDIKTKIESVIKITKKIDLIIIDYLQLMELTSIKKESRTSEISEISRILKIIAKNYNASIVALSQLNRNLEQRYDKRPIMADLRESGALEQDADLIVFIYRDEVYNKNNKNKGLAEIIIGKQRNGPIGVINLLFNGENSQFENT